MSATGHPAVRSSTAASSRCDSARSKNRAISGLENRNCRALENDRGAVEEVRGQVEPRIGPERHGHVQVARTALQEQIDRLDGAGRQQLHLVEHEQARVRVELNRTGQHSQLLLERR